MNVLTNEIGGFRLVGLNPGQYTVEFAPPTEYTLAEGQSTVIGPFEVSPDRPASAPAFLPIYLADAQGNGLLIMLARSIENNAGSKM